MTDQASPYRHESPPLVVVGVVALDTIETPHLRVEDLLGGGATYFALAASLYGPVGMVSAVGSDFPPHYLNLLAQRGVDLAGVQTIPGATFRWACRYGRDWNHREVLELSPNAFSHFRPHLQKSPFLFLSTMDPQLQLLALQQRSQNTLTLVDTMDHWIRHQTEELGMVLAKAELVTLNEEEAHLMTDERDMAVAARNILRMGPKGVIVKKGNRGVTLFSASQCWEVAAVPVAQVVDPTGAGDAFAGGVMGYLTAQGQVTERTLAEALPHGAAVASLVVEDWGVQGLLKGTRELVEQRRQALAAPKAFPLPRAGRRQ
ncbi:MAG: sugar kinase [Chloroflexi bacterium]|nr:sugar kinase [Chloroflexota bacterium]